MNDPRRRLSLRLLAGASGTARADGPPPGRGWEAGDAAGYEPGDGAGVVSPAGACEFSVDGVVWRGQVKLGPARLKSGKDGTVRVRVRSAGRQTCVASLASYRTHGATWKSSGLQVFHDWDTITVAGQATGVLRIAVPDAGCFGQVDLYRDDVVYDGLLDARDGRRHGPLPQGPDRPVIKERLIAAWNGGTRDCVPRQTPEPDPSADTPAAPVPSAPSPAGSAGPAGPAGPATPSPTVPTPSVPEGGEPQPGTNPVAPSPMEHERGRPGGELARIGASDTGVHAGLGVLLLGAGGGVLMLRRRCGGTGPTDRT
ncbi:hypothetical protein BJP40_01195 [Streptomyces sp. CC53]|uniref:hypothetical protein n=1 Tax=unclassified Streptomyces TaxID=2593676 RepID=UPI0008DCE6BE|nr:MULTISPECIES: hypothetical protein [unclassified Streptomyces]OII65536.1 hypothetical protein BJP40_01195 [Streptomyces sp. CC53]